MIGPERRTAGKNGAGFGRAEVADIAAGDTLWLGVHVKEKIPALALVDGVEVEVEDDLFGRARACTSGKAAI